MIQKVRSRIKIYLLEFSEFEALRSKADESNVQVVGK